MIFSGVLGYPVERSLSIPIHNFWLQQLKLDAAYLPLSVPGDQLAQALSGLRVLGFTGATVAAPHKDNIIPLLDGVHPTAQRVRSVNLLVRQPDGRWLGDSTEGAGFLAALQQQAPQWHKQKPAMVLGAGGAARIVSDALHQAGVPEIRVVNRTADRITQLAQELGIPLTALDWSQAEAALSECGLLVNTTSLGMIGQPELPLRLERLPLDAVVFDLIYQPALTPLLKQALLHGQIAINGLDMLLHQAVPGFAAWFGHTPVVSPDLRQHIEAVLS